MFAGFLHPIEKTVDRRTVLEKKKPLDRRWLNYFLRKNKTFLKKKTALDIICSFLLIYLAWRFFFLTNCRLLPFFFKCHLKITLSSVERSLCRFVCIAQRTEIAAAAEASEFLFVLTGGCELHVLWFYTGQHKGLCWKTFMQLHYF